MFFFFVFSRLGANATRVWRAIFYFERVEKKSWLEILCAKNSDFTSQEYVAEKSENFGP
jgi:hypothetical protein